jgi:hypothetical protein
VAALNGISHGYEIKSSSDTLMRLDLQVRAYGSVFDKASLVVAKCHLAGARTVLPRWLILAAKSDDGVRLSRLRASRLNPGIDARSLANLLWRPELLKALEAYGLDTGLRSKPSAALVEVLTRTFSVAEISHIVRSAIRARGDWQAASRLKRCDGSVRQPASRLRFRCIHPLNMS